MFQWLVEKSLASRLFVLVSPAVLMLWGGLQATRLPVDVFPDLNKPTVTLMTEAGGMAPEEVEQLISFPLETAMSGLPGVAGIRSVSSAGLSFIYISFDWGVDIYRARQMVSERLTALEAACRRACRAWGRCRRSWVRSCWSPFRLPGAGRFGQCQGGARIRRLGAAPPADGDFRCLAGHPDWRRGAPVPGAAGYAADGRRWASASIRSRRR
jgi:hypothetical protein